MGYRLTPDEWPACLRGQSKVKGVYVGGCIIGHDKRFYRTEDNQRVALAHAHTKGKHKGFICIPYKSRLRDKRLMLHELAHIMAGGGHSFKWKHILLSLGGSLEGRKLVGSTLRTKNHSNLSILIHEVSIAKKQFLQFLRRINNHS